MFAAVLAIGCCIPASAQEAAETAQILSGSGSQGKAARSLGSAISGSMARAANSIRATRSPAPVTTSRRAGTPRQGYVIAPGGNDLEGTDAPTYRLGNGSSIRVSGRLVQDPATTCVQHCRNAAASAATAPSPAR